MEFIINNECFNKAISEVSKAVSLKNPFPILTGIKLIAEKNCLILVGSNSDIVIEKIIPLMINDVKVLEVYKTGSIVISAKYLSEIVKKLPHDIHIKVNGKQLVTIQSDEIVINLNGFNTEEYPSLPQIDEATYTKIPSIELIEAINQTVFAVSKSESRPVLTGVNMSFKENQLSCVATNSHRLALRELAIETNVNGSFNVPGASLNELIKLIKNEIGEIHIYMTDSYIVFKSDTISLFSRLIEGNYPNISGLLPKDSKTIITLDTIQLLKGIDRACLFANEWRNNKVNLEIKDGTKIRIFSNSSELGEIEETQNIKMISGEKELSISLDGSFLIDALKVIKEEEIRLSFDGSMRPVLIEPVDNSSYRHLISPVRSY
ncbi:MULTISPECIES: DNA polymerase III subunit beta [Bacillus cereus group]|uniref:Beta sliding clamp n=1 Tax=Bacillus cereus TaxID=1396 RepID=A0AA44TER4_BACCE|nr:MULTISPECIES: DNA polymerase III subunit beta [Bacillus cereus group]EEL50317.1 DNA polymerase III, beta subunit [Bacillus cereus Rock3-44]PFA17733.1 DNA polymerase III subunit beta [Bacillus cereus]PFN07273.1 DNA polymerase III subunit beta [Bacillus cereus]PFS01380.1 DNA polymerase III subunit beta [Bacillus cereus]PGZ16186.1 DNA polymerase III subunit beta [Bacillus cereus]